MARPIKEGLDYFPHDTNASNDSKLEAMIAIHGLAGYGFYFMLLEKIYSSSDGTFDVKNPLILTPLLKKMGIKNKKFTEFFLTAIQLSLFFENQDGKITSKRICQQMKDIKLKREAWNKKKSENEKEIFPKENSTRKTPKENSEGKPPRKLDKEKKILLKEKESLKEILIPPIIPQGGNEKNLKPEEKIIQPEKVSSSLLSGIDFTEKLNSAKLTNLVNTINQHSGLGSSVPPLMDLAKIYTEILSGIMPELRYGKFDKATSSLIADMWHDGVTAGEEWVKFFTEISLSSYLQGKTKIKGSDNCYNTGLRYCLKNYNEVLSGTKRDKPEDTEDIMDSYNKLYGPQSETFDSDDTIECQNYTVEEV